LAHGMQGGLLCRRKSIFQQINVVGHNW
jgi:hypothetical protein